MVAAMAIRTTKYSALLNEPEGVSGKGVTGNVSMGFKSRTDEKTNPASKLARIGVR